MMNSVIFRYQQGNGINVARIAPYTAVQFMTYEECKKVTLYTYIEKCFKLQNIHDVRAHYLTMAGTPSAVKENRMLVKIQ